MTTLSIIVASSGRPTLARTLESARSQMHDGDEILVSVNQDCPWGHRARNQLMTAARGDAVMFIDDDDCYRPDALHCVRSWLAVEPGRMHMFRMRYANGFELWTDRELRLGNVSTQMVVVPGFRRAGFPYAPWQPRYEGDWDFIRTAALPGNLGEPVWHEDVIALVRP
jgi:hypothetical protein